MTRGPDAVSEAFLPQQEINISWGKHWTEMLINLSLAVLEK